MAYHELSRTMQTLSCYKSCSISLDVLIDFLSCYILVFLISACFLRFINMSQEIKSVIQQANVQLQEIDAMNDRIVSTVQETFDEYVNMLRKDKEKIVDDVRKQCETMKQSVENEVDAIVNQKIQTQQAEIEQQFEHKKTQILTQLRDEKTIEMNKLNEMRNWKK